MKNLKMFRSPDGTEWNVQVQMPGSSNAMVLFRHPDGASSHRDRYNWYISTGPEARSVTTRLSPEIVLKALDEVQLAKLFSRSIAVSRPATSAKTTLGL
jgi:hypothetical protein